jgi:hypothetical protein
LCVPIKGNAYALEKTEFQCLAYAEIFQGTKDEQLFLEQGYELFKQDIPITFEEFLEDVVFGLTPILSGLMAKNNI